MSDDTGFVCKQNKFHDHDITLYTQWNAKPEIDNMQALMIGDGFVCLLVECIL